MVTVGGGAVAAVATGAVTVLKVVLGSAELVGPGDSGGFTSVVIVGGVFTDTDDVFVLFLFVDEVFGVGLFRLLPPKNFAFLFDLFFCCSFKARTISISTNTCSFEAVELIVVVEEVRRIRVLLCRESSPGQFDGKCSAH